MISKGRLERTLATLQLFDHPRIDLEQYPTPPEIAAHLVVIMDANRDIINQTIVDLGAGTGLLSIGTAFGNPNRVIAIEVDHAAIDIARQNERVADCPVAIDWVRANVLCDPLCVSDAVVVMNPPFGAQQTRRHADKEFLHVAKRIGSVSYSFHNEGSRDFIDAFTADTGGTVTHAWSVMFDLARQFEFHTDEISTIPVELYRIEWDQEL